VHSNSQIARRRRNNEKTDCPLALSANLIFFIFVAVSVRLATVAASITWKRV
jgi:hypothetical protein